MKLIPPKDTILISAIAICLLLLLPLALHSSPLPTSSLASSTMVPQSMFTTPYLEIFKIQNSTSEPYPYVLSPSANGTVWILTVKQGTIFTSQIVKFTLATGPRPVLTIHTSPFGFPNSIMADSKTGSVWFPINDTLSYYDPALTTPHLAVNYTGGGPQYVALDGQGRVWVTLSTSNQIAMYDPSNPRNNATFAVPTQNALLQGITAAPDGTVWFAEAESKKLGRLDPNTGKISEYAAPPSVVSPTQLVVDSKGVLWFSDHASDEFSSYNPATGEWTKIPVGYCPGKCPLALPNAIALDASGNVWFSEHIAGKVARYNPASKILTEYIVPVSPWSSGIVEPQIWWAWPGPDNLVWFTDTRQGDIGFVNASVPVPLEVSVDKELSIRRGETETIRPTVKYTGNSTVSVGVSLAYSDSSLLSGGYVQNVIAGSNTSQPPVSIGAGWNVDLDPRYVMVTASDGRIAVSVPIRLTVSENFSVYATLATSMTLIVVAVWLYTRRTKKTAGLGATAEASLPPEKS